jgi:hypothetical protein
MAQRHRGLGALESTIRGRGRDIAEHETCGRLPAFVKFIGTNAGNPAEPGMENTMSRHTALALIIGLLCSGVGFFGAGVVRSDVATAQTPATGTVIVTLGIRGGPFPTKDRTQSSNLLVVNGTPYLIDAGDGVTRRIVQAGSSVRTSKPRALAIWLFA